MAADLYIWHNDKPTRLKIAYDNVHLAYIMGLIYACTQELLEKGEISHRIRMGINWDGDGVLVYDQSFDDLPHIELIKV